MKQQSALPDLDIPSPQKARADFPIPEPMELAKLAAMLEPHGPPDAALKRAMEFYFEAVMFSQELPSSFDDLLQQYGGNQRQRDALMRKLAEAWEKDVAEALELDPQQDDDAVRRFLRERGLPLKNSRSVLDNVRRCWNELPKETAHLRESAYNLIKRCEQVKDSNIVYAIPRFVLEIVANFAKGRRSESKRKAWKSRQNKSSV